MKDYVYWSKEPETMSLCHHGVKGMKWGVRRTPEQLADEDQYRSGHDSIQIIDQNALTKISSKPVSFLEEFKARKFYDSWSKYIN